MTADLLQRARILSSAEHAKDLRPLIISKIEPLRSYDVPNMEQALAVCFWGRSGSYLVASYLDGHDDIVMLPPPQSSQIYPFLESYPSLALYDKLITYPIFVGGFFDGDFPIVAADYYAAVAALFEVYGSLPPQLLETRRAFFQFLHVAYSLALGRRPASPHPVMVYSQHWWDDVQAQTFVYDFPQARFLHTVRDPIAAYDRTFEAWSKGGNDPAVKVIDHLIKCDQPYSGMKSRSRAIRFEDLHKKAAETMSRLMDWLGLPHHIALSRSTFNGRPYEVERDGTKWSGPRLEQAKRSSRNVAFTDRALLFALFYENFVAWNYSCPKIFRHPLIRSLTCMLVLPIPMKTEIIVAWATIRVRVLPSLRRGSFWLAFRGILRILKLRLLIMRLVAAEFYRRLRFGKIVLEML